jgi:hypothetical protein
VGFDWGLDPARRPLEGPFVSAAVCLDCHPAQVAEWRPSRHARAWTDEVFREGFIQEPLEPCASCHAPFAEQSREALRNLPHYRSRRRVDGGPIVPALPEPKAEEGVTCAVCHLRGGVVVGPGLGGVAAHPVEVSPGLRDGEVCRPCHEFPFVESVDGRLVVTDEPMQRTWTEWRASGSTETCVGCHMPAGSHRLRGIDDLDWLRASVVVSADAAGFTLHSVGVGHNLPTGDLFRRLSLEVEGAVVAELGRRFALREEADGLHKREVADTTLRPGEARRVPYPGADRARWRLLYHKGSPEDEARARVSSDRLVIELAASPSARGAGRE